MAEIVGVDVDGVRGERGVVVVPVPGIEGMPIEAGIGHGHEDASAGHAPFVDWGGPQHQRHVVRHTKVVVIHPWRQRRLEEEWWRLWISPVHKALEVGLGS